MRVYVERTVLRNIGIFERGAGGFVAGKRIQQHIAGGAVLQLVDELSAFADHLRRGVHEASEHNLALDGEVGDTLRRFGRNTGEHRGSFGSATVIAGTVKQGILIQEHPLLTQCIDERDVQGHVTGESNGGRQAIILDRDAHRVQQHRQRVALPCGHADHERQLRHAGNPAFGGLVIQHAPNMAFGGLKHTRVAEQRIQPDMAGSEQLGDAGGMGMGHLQLRGQLIHILERRWRLHAAVLVTPATDAIQTFHEILVLSLALGHLSTHFPTASRYS